MENDIVIDRDNPFYEVVKERQRIVLEIEEFIERHVSGKKLVADLFPKAYFEEGALVVPFDEFKRMAYLDGMNIERAKHIGMGLIDMAYQRVCLQKNKNKYLVRNRRRTK